MVRNFILYIFIYTLLIGCNTRDWPVAPNNSGECESDFTMNVEAPELEMDENGYYHIEWLDGYNQTFTTLEAITNTEGWNKIYWMSQSGIEYNGEFVSCVNPASYTNDGVARQTMAVWEEMIGDTLIIYAGFEDWCSEEHNDYIGVVVEDEI
jgi:hypothetical protein